MYVYYIYRCLRQCTSLKAITFDFSSPVERPPWLSSYGSLKYNYLCNQCLSPLKVVSSNSAHGEVYSIQLYVITFVSQKLATGVWFSPGTPVSSTIKTDLHDITVILMKVALSTITLTLTIFTCYDVVCIILETTENAGICLMNPSLRRLLEDTKSQLLRYIYSFT